MEGLTDMDVKAINESKDGFSAQLLIKGTTPTFMNTMRRAIMSETPTLAIQTMRVYENNSVIFDEMLANRLGLVAVRGSKHVNLDDEAKLGLDKEGPCTVYSKDIKVLSGHAEVVHENIPLLKLSKGQKIKAELVAVGGIGKMHAKHQPASVGYQHVFEIKIGKPEVHPDKVASVSAKGLYEVKAGKLVVADAYQCDGSNALEEMFPENDIKVTAKPHDFLMNVNGFGQYSLSELMDNAASVLHEKNAAFKKNVNAL